MKKLTGFLFIVLLLLVTTASDCDSNPQGFNIDTNLGIFVGGRPVIIAHRFVSVFGVRTFDLPGATGTVTQLPFGANSGDIGRYRVPDGRAPARWQIGEFSGPCANIEKVFEVERGQTLEVLCDTTCTFLPCNNRRPFVAVPDYVDASNPPSTITITGEGIDATYGMPFVQFFDLDGNLIAQLQASAVAPDGFSLEGATPDLSSISTNSYLIVISNVTADGTEVIGSTTIFLDNGLPPPPPPPDPTPDPCTGPSGVQMPCQIN